MFDAVNGMVLKSERPTAGTLTALRVGRKLARMSSTHVVSNHTPESKSTICPPCSQVIDLLSTADDERICEAMLCLLDHAPLHRQTGARLVGCMTVRDVARELCKSEAWVRRHQDELGVIRIGTGRGADLLFSRKVVQGYLCKHADEWVQL